MPVNKKWLGGTFIKEPIKMKKSLMSCQEDIQRDSLDCPRSTIKPRSEPSEWRTTQETFERKEGGGRLNVPPQESCSTRNCRSSRRLNVTQQSQTCIILHNVTQFTTNCHGPSDFQRWNYRVLQTQLVYLCSCFHPRERHSSECRCTPEKCWCTCCCGRRTCCPHRELKYKT